MAGRFRPEAAYSRRGGQRELRSEPPREPWHGRARMPTRQWKYFDGGRLNIAAAFLDQRARNAPDSTDDGDRRRLHEETVYGAARGF